MKILVPLDGSPFSEAVLGLVDQLAEAADAQVHLLTVVEEPHVPSSWARALSMVGEAEGDFDMTGRDLTQVSPPSDSAEVKETRESALRSATEYLDGVAGRFSPGKAKTRALLGSRPADEILAFSHEEEINLIAMSTHGRSGLGRWVYGSTADKLLHSIRVPLLVLRPREEEGTPSQRRPVDTLVVPLDGSDLAESALSHVEELAGQLGVKISLLWVVPPLTIAYPSGEHYAYEPRLDVDMENAAVNYLRQKQAELEAKGFKADYTVKRGHPATSIIDFAEEREGSLIVMSTHGRSGIGRWILGSVADRVLRASYRPVLLLRSQDTAS